MCASVYGLLFLGEVSINGLHGVWCVAKYECPANTSALRTDAWSSVRSSLFKDCYLDFSF